MNDDLRTREELIAALQDITRKYDALRVSYKNQMAIQKRIEHELERTRLNAEVSEQLKLDLLNHVVHIIRAPINGILGFTVFLNYPDVTAEERIQYTDIIRGCAKRLSKLAERLFNLEALKSGRMKPQFSDINITEILDWIYEDFINQAQDKRLNLILKNSLPAETNIINSDWRRVNDILRIFIENAISYTTTGTVEFGCAKKDNGILFWINDTGPGMSESMIDIITLPHDQENKYENFKFGDPGEGLYIARTYIEMLGGSLSVESEQDNGSTIFFTLPSGK